MDTGISSLNPISSLQKVEETTTEETVNQLHDAEETTVLSIGILFILFFIMLNEVALQILHKLRQKYPTITRYIQSTSVTTMIGVIAGIIIYIVKGSSISQTFQEDFSQLFFQILLPPILFESALNMEKVYLVFVIIIKNNFFKNFGGILLFAIFGTLIACALTAGLMFTFGKLALIEQVDLTYCLIFGALISATDPVAVLAIFKEMSADKTLYALIFGESIFNDAVSLILYDTFVQKLYRSSNTSMTSQLFDGMYHFLLTFFGSLFIGMIIGMLCALVTIQLIIYNILQYLPQESKLKVNQVELDKVQNREVTIMLLIPWVSYLVAQGLKFSGIVSIMSCGISMAQYAIPNLSPGSTKLIQKLYHTLAYNCENLVFLFIGIGFFGFSLIDSWIGWKFFLFIIVILLFARYIQLQINSWLINIFAEKDKISDKFVFIMWFSGFRGAMAYCLAMQGLGIFDLKWGRFFLTLTLSFAIVNIFLQGGLLLPLLEKCDIQDNSRVEEKINKVKQDESLKTPKKQYFLKKISHIIKNFEQNFLQKNLMFLPFIAFIIILIRYEKSKEQELVHHESSAQIINLNNQNDTYEEQYSFQQDKQQYQTSEYATLNFQRKESK